MHASADSLHSVVAIQGRGNNSVNSMFLDFKFSV